MKKKFKVNTKEGLFFWITGLAGSGKSSIARDLKSKIIRKYGPTLIVSGDSLRNIFKNRKYEKNERLKFAKQKMSFCKFVLKQKINVIYSTISLFDEVRKMNKRAISNYVEIYIKADLKKIIRFNKKKIYHKTKKNNVWGLHLKPEFPKNPSIIIKNDFKNKTPFLANQLFKKINNIL